MIQVKFAKMCVLIFGFLLTGIVNSEGSLWKENRSFLMNRHFGMQNWAGSRSQQIESALKSQVRQLVSTIDADFDGVPVDPTALFNCSISNVICSMVMSKSFHYKDPQFRRFMHNFSEGFRLFTETGALMFMPWLKYFTRGTSKACAQLKANREEMLQFVKQVKLILKDSVQRFYPVSQTPKFNLKKIKKITIFFTLLSGY